MVENCQKKIPSRFAETVQLVERYVLEQIERETANKQLYYHTKTHALAVKRRANFIFQALEPVFREEPHFLDYSRVKSLLDLCALSHDMVQSFVKSNELHAPRKRPVGASEKATTKKLIDYIQVLNQRLTAQKVASSVKFTPWDLKIIRESIAATICDRDPLAGKTDYSFSEYSIYQPYLYSSRENKELVAQIIALADLGTLGIDGIESFLQEGALILLEENPDLVPLILSGDCAQLAEDTERQTKARLLKMNRFIVNLAKERYSRFPQEIKGFSERAQEILRERVFQNLTLANIQKIEKLTPTQENTTLKELLSFLAQNCSLEFNYG